MNTLSRDGAGAQPESLRWFWIAAFWGGIGLFDATQTVILMRAEGMHHYWVRLFFTQLFAWVPYAGDAVCAAFEPPIPSRTVETCGHVERAFGRVRGHRSGVCRVGRVVGKGVEPVCIGRGHGGLSTFIVLEVLRRAAWVCDP